MVTVGGQQKKIQFAQAMRDVDSRINDVIGDVSTGFYPQQNVGCTVNNPTNVGSSPAPSGSAAQGTNEPCIFIGKALQFSPSATNGEGLNILTVVGRRQRPGIPSALQVGNLEEANPVAFTGLTQTDSLGFGLQVPAGGMKYGSPGSYLDLGSVGFFSSFGQYNTAGNNLLSGAQKLNLAWIPGTSLGQTATDAADAVAGVDSTHLNPESVVICFEDSGGDQRGFITIGGSGRQLTTELTLDGECPT